MKKLLLVDKNGTELQLHKYDENEYELKLTHFEDDTTVTFELDEEDRIFLMLELMNLKNLAQK